MAAGTMVQVLPDVRAVLAPNASPFTHTGTWTYLLGAGEVALIDPGPDDDCHLAAVLAALSPGENISHILVTHSHADHSGLTAKLRKMTTAPVFAFGPSVAGRSALMRRIAHDIGGGEGVDRGFTPDILLRDGEMLDGGNWQVEALHIPGHMANHLAFLGKDFAFTGDHVLGFASTFISPPDGDLAQFRTSCERLRRCGRALFLPGHGDPISDPQMRISWLLAHRQKREDEVLAALARGTASADDLLPRIYADLPAAAHPAAKRNLLAHLSDLWQRGLVSADPGPAHGARWSAP